MCRMTSSGPLLFFVFCMVISGLTSVEASQEEESLVEHKVTNRPMVVISDLHFGVGKTKKDIWDPTEDFRWSNELVGFLKRLPQELGKHIDLIIAGDLLELWQPRADVVCAADNSAADISEMDPEMGCRVREMEKILDIVINSHAQDLLELGSFASRADNRVFILPGNHDAAIIEPPLWAKLKPTFGNIPDGRLILIPEGVWSSDDGFVVVEHGNQIVPDVNRFSSWPQIVKDDVFSRPWGELFVQRLYNEKERIYPLIDNLIPESAGVAYYAELQGIFGKARDFGKFLFFNLFQTSLAQKGAFLGSTEENRNNWDIQYARKQLGHRLFASAMDLNSTLRVQLLEDQSPYWVDLRAHLDSMLKDQQSVSDPEIRMLCDQAAIRYEESSAYKDKKRKGQSNSLLKEKLIITHLCQSPTAGHLLKTYLIPREWIMRSHLNHRIASHPNMKIFVYGHTHVHESAWTVKSLNYDRSVLVYNSGAFQRLVDGELFGEIAKQKRFSPHEALKVLAMDDLPPCYSAVFIQYNSSIPHGDVKNWYHIGRGQGELTSGKDTRCPKTPM